jgi:hypothetical protein
LQPIEKMTVQHDAFVKACRQLMDAIKANKPFEEWDPLADDVAKQSQALMVHIDGLLELNDHESDVVANLADSASRVGELIALVGGSGHDALHSHVSARYAPGTGIHYTLELATPAKRTRRPSPAVAPSAAATPQQIIPFDNEDFQDF